jgi:hypothetical protein
MQMWKSEDGDKTDIDKIGSALVLLFSLLMRSPTGSPLQATERAITIRCMVAALAIAALSVSLIYGLT